jgi:hypothetical protein
VLTNQSQPLSIKKPRIQINRITKQFLKILK